MKFLVERGLPVAWINDNRKCFYATGMRLSELIGLDDADIDFSASLIKVTGKRNKQRLIPFGDELRLSLLNYIKVRNEAVPDREKAFFCQAGREETVSYEGV